MSSLLTASNVRAGYTQSDILHGVSISVGTGEAVGLLGANGTGKTTLLRALTGLLPLRSGSVTYRGEDISRWAPERRVAQGIAMVPEGRQLFPGLTVEENLHIGAMHVRRDRREVREDLEWVLSVFPELKDKMRREAGTLSGGEQQMCAIGRALMSRPSLILVDELSLGLAPIVTLRLTEALAQAFRQRGFAIFLVEQDINVVLNLCSRSYVLARGKVVREESTGAIRADSDLLRLILGVNTSA